MLIKLGFLIKFKHIFILNLIIFEKYNIIYFLLDNISMYLNSIKKPNVSNLNNYT